MYLEAFYLVLPLFVKTCGRLLLLLAVLYTATTLFL